MQTIGIRRRGSRSAIPFNFQGKSYQWGRIGFSWPAPTIVTLSRSIQLKKGETTTIEFLAQTPGTYSFKCCHVCGLGHRGMKGQVVVDQ
jgi:hypothetical protein